MPHRILVPLLAAAFALAGCDDNASASFEQCELDLTLEPSSAAPGEQVVASGRPLTDALDTAVRVDGTDAEVVEVVVSDACAACDSCYASQECGVCTTCEACAEDCAECTEQLTFTVPDTVPAGRVGVQVLNRFGVSPILNLDVTADAE